MHFKTNNPTGRYRSFSDPTADIIEGKSSKCGWIGKGKDQMWYIWLHVKNETPDGFKNIRLKQGFESLHDAKIACKEKWNLIKASPNFTIHRLN